jgi:formiminoglutamase
MLSKPPFDYHAGTSPLLLSIPHGGTDLPDSLHGRLTPLAGQLPDTDWHLRRLYDFAETLGATIVSARYSRFAVDLNRPSDDTPLYTTATTGLHPDTLFDGSPVFADGRGLSAEEKGAFLHGIWRPYHERLATELARIKAQHGYAILFDAHSIAGEVPRLFEGSLADFNIGTADGKSADARLTERLAAVAGEGSRYRVAVNGRFKGGHITRHYGKPGEHIHAVQLEMAQRTYMREAHPFDYVDARADEVRPVLRRFVETMLDWGRGRYG